MNGSDKIYLKESLIGNGDDEEMCKSDRVMREANDYIETKIARSFKIGYEVNSMIGERGGKVDNSMSSMLPILRHSHQEEGESGKLKFIKRIQKPSSIMLGNPTEVKSLFQQNNYRTSIPLSRRQKSLLENRSRPLLTISFQQSISINLKQTSVYFSQLRFLSSHLSELIDQQAAPLIVLQDSIPSNSQLFSAIQKIWPELRNSKTDINPCLLNQRLKQIPEHPNTLKCKCGRKAERNLPCSHAICKLCLNSQENCAVCYLVINKASLEAINCLICKEIKTKIFTCFHYCLDCIKKQMLLTEELICDVCEYRFDKLVINAIYKRCGNCKAMKAKLFEICRDCYCCGDCLYFSLISNQCKCCNNSIPSTTVENLRRNALVPCVSCMKSFHFDRLCVKNCCKSIMCQTCAAFPCKICRKPT